MIFRRRARGPFDRGGPAAPYASIIAMAMMLLALHGLVVDIVPAPFLAGAGPFWLCIAFGGVATWWMFLLAVEHGRIEPMRRRAGWLGLWPMALLAPLVIGFLFWSVATRSLPWFWTSVLGTGTEQRATMELQHTRGRSGGMCRDRFYGGPLGDLAFVCAGAGFHDAPAGSTPVVLRGKSSALGLIVTDVRRADAFEVPSGEDR